MKFPRGTNRPWIYGEDAEPGGKQCVSCHALKPLAEYDEWAKGRDGYRATCKACGVKRTKRYWQNKAKQERMEA